MFDLLRSWEKKSAAADDLLHSALKESEFPARDAALVTELFYGCLRQRRALEWLMGQKADLAKTKLDVAILARLGLYQLFYLDKIPAHAAVHSTVELCKKKMSGREAGFLNAVLRNALRDRPNLASGLQRQSVAVRGSHPDWLVDRWLARYGEGPTRELLDWNNRPPTLFARVNTLKTTADALIAKVREAGVEAELWQPSGTPSTPLLADLAQRKIVLKFTGSCVPERLPGFAEGEFYIQDPSTLLSVDLLGAKPGERILDACAAPGGKTTYLGQVMQDGGEIVAEDSSSERLKLVVANCVRLGIRIVTVRQARGADSSESWFDRVLLDVPCSNTGVLRRRVDARWRLTKEDVARLASDQLRLLQSASTRVKRGGTLVYSTCSIEPEENRAVVESFVQAQPEFQLEQCLETLPCRDGLDGMFSARLVRSQTGK